MKVELVQIDDSKFVLSFQKVFLSSKPFLFKMMPENKARWEETLDETLCT